MSSMTKGKISKLLLVAIGASIFLTILVGAWTEKSYKLSNPAYKDPIRFTHEIANLRNERYCEVLYGNRNFLTLEIKVFSTQGINNYPNNLWGQITKESVAISHNASFVMLNGPRFWAMDQINATKSETEGMDDVFSNLPMKQRATLSLNLTEQFFKAHFYSPRAANRTTQFIYEAGKNIYELISPKGEVYVMQSFSHTGDYGVILLEPPPLTKSKN